MSCSLFKPTTPLRTKIGVVVTAVYLLLLGLLLYGTWPDLIELKLNELGDFAAGAFGPLAFLWLILGYMQQGDELKQNTDALRLQAEELANTVEQQKELVALGYAQLQREKELAEEERSRQIRAARPKFDFSIPSDASTSDGWIRLNIDVKNVGASCSKLRTLTITKGVYFSLTRDSRQGQFWQITASALASEPFETFDFYVAYLDLAGNMGRQLVSVNSLQDEDGYSWSVYGEDDMRLYQAKLDQEDK